MNKDIIIVAVMTLLLVAVSIHFGYSLHEEIGSIIRNIKQNNITAPEECHNLSMEETAYCLNDYVNSIFKYKIRPDNENPTLEELIEEGGDCANWADLYLTHIDNLGFYGNRTRMLIGTETAHVIAIISDETGYCILDQRSISCFKLIS